MLRKLERKTAEVERRALELSVKTRETEKTEVKPILRPEPVVKVARFNRNAWIIPVEHYLSAKMLNNLAGSLWILAGLVILGTGLYFGIHWFLAHSIPRGMEWTLNVGGIILFAVSYFFLSAGHRRLTGCDMFEDDTSPKGLGLLLDLMRWFR